MKELNERFPKKRAFITGAGSGLGAAFANLLFENGWTLFLSDIKTSSLKSYHDAANVFIYALDVSDKEQFEGVYQKVAAESEKIDLLINNAGIGDGELFRYYLPEHWVRMVQINLMGVYYGCHFMLPLLEDQEDALIINIGSAAGYMNAPGMSAYNATKAAVYSLSETLAHELEESGVQVSVATPSFFQTNIMEEAKGGEQFVNFAKKQMRYAQTNATEMAQVILIEAAKGRFQIVHPANARRNRWLKKWLPGLVKNQFKKMLDKFSR